MQCPGPDSPLLLASRLEASRVFHPSPNEPLLGGSWVVISRVISKVTMLMTPVRALITPVITTHEPPSTVVWG